MVLSLPRARLNREVNTGNDGANKLCLLLESPGLLCGEQNNRDTYDCWAKASAMNSQCIMLGRRP